MNKYQTLISVILIGLLANPAQALEYKKTQFSAKFYGALNRAFLISNDGVDTVLFPFVSNSNSSSRLGLDTLYNFDNGFRFKTRFEFQYRYASTSDINVFDRDGSNRFNFSFTTTSAIRHIYGTIENDKYGSLSVGQSGVASDGAANVDLSGTRVAGLDPELTAGGLFFFDNLSNAFITTREIRDDFDNLDGLRRFRVRYDTPTYKGFTLSASHGRRVILPENIDDRRWESDIALRYRNDHGDFKVQAAAFYNFRNSRSGLDENRNRLGSSAALLHKPSGLNGRFSLGLENQDNRTRNGTFIHTKLGLLRNFFKFGQTALSVDLYASAGLANESAQGQSWGVAAVQKIDKTNLELYTTYRNYSLDKEGRNFSDINIVLTGARWKF